jgi:hypothetical protein
MNASSLRSIAAVMQSNPCEIEPASSGGTRSFGPELLLVMIGLMAVGLVAGVLSTAAATTFLAGGTGAVLLSMLREESAA